MSQSRIGHLSRALVFCLQVEVCQRRHLGQVGQPRICKLRCITDIQFLQLPHLRQVNEP